MDQQRNVLHGEEKILYVVLFSANIWRVSARDNALSIPVLVSYKSEVKELTSWKLNKYFNGFPKKYS